MSVAFQNFDYSYLRDGKPVFAPSALGRKIGEDIKAKVEVAYPFGGFVYHLRATGGHVAALHRHRPHLYFARIDIRRFFYSISRNRIGRALSGIGIPRAIHYAKWSCVKNPYGGGYVLPYGFVQSPVLATLVLMASGVGALLRQLDAEGVVTVSVYMDDISLSSNDLGSLKAGFEALQQSLTEANFEVSPDKVRAPAPAMDVFNCDLQQGKTNVQAERIERFEAEPRSGASADAFADYCLSVENGNA